jgi:hypothetical protein
VPLCGRAETARAENGGRAAGSCQLRALHNRTDTDNVVDRKDAPCLPPRQGDFLAAAVSFQRG